jgi:hypothetical protein
MHRALRGAARALAHMQRGSGYPCPPYKIIVLDEADAVRARDALT